MLKPNFVESVIYNGIRYLPSHVFFVVVDSAVSYRILRCERELFESTRSAFCDPDIIASSVEVFCGRIDLEPYVHGSIAHYFYGDLDLVRQHWLPA